MHSRTPLPVTLSALMLAGLASSMPAYGSGRQELLLFLSGQGDYNFSADSGAVDDFDFLAKADLVYSYTNDRIRVLGEYLYSSEESELERFQVGWEANDETLIWLGRFHQPANVWNEIYHHGQYLQTSISRPGVASFEDEGGSRPSHSTGLLLETGRSLADGSGIRFSLSFGSAPIWQDDGLEPLDLLDPESGHGLAGSTRIAWFPDYLLDQVLLQTVVAMSETLYRRRLLSLTFRFGNPPPRKYALQENLAAALGSQKNTVTYMWAEDVVQLPQMKILKVLWIES